MPYFTFASTGMPPIKMYKKQVSQAHTRNHRYKHNLRQELAKATQLSIIEDTLTELGLNQQLSLHVLH